VELPNCYELFEFVVNMMQQSVLVCGHGEHDERRWRSKEEEINAQ
jgi:hypothetical protein